MKTDVSRQAAATLAAVNRELRRAEDLTWDDPGFLEWEREQLSELETGKVAFRGGEVVLGWWADPGPGHDRHCAAVGVHRAPMVQIADDHPGDCPDQWGDEPYWGRTAMRMGPADYPDEHITHGPLLLGPEPPIVGTLCATCVGTGEVLLGDIVECEECDGTGCVEMRGATADLAISDETLALYAGDVDAIAQRYRTENGGAR